MNFSKFSRSMTHWFLISFSLGTFGVMYDLRQGVCFQYSHLEEIAFAPVNKSSLDSTVQFLNALVSAEKIPSDLKSDASYCLHVITADTSPVSNVSLALQTLDALKTADESMILHQTYDFVSFCS